MLTIRDENFRIIATSRNLRGITDRNRQITVARVDIWPDLVRGTAQLGVTWSDGSSTVTDFADFGVCKNWCKARRAFPAATVHVKGQA